MHHAYLHSNFSIFLCYLTIQDKTKGNKIETNFLMAIFQGIKTILQIYNSEL